MLALLLISATLALGLTMIDSEDQADDAQDDMPDTDALRDQSDLPATVSMPDISDAPTPTPEVVEDQPVDEVVSGTANDDVILTGDGDDDVMAGAGNDLVRLGAGNDAYGTWGLTESDLEDMQGDDTVRGGAGADRIIDTQGSNLLQGSLGGDFLDATDYRDAGTADTVSGGYGDDTLLLDDGDVASGGAGEDDFDIHVNEFNPGAAVTITDFDPDTEVVSIFIGRSLENVIPEITITHDDTQNIATVLFDGTPIATLLDVDAAGVENTRVIIVG